MDEKTIQELVKMFDKLLDYTMYMRMVTRYDGGIKDNLILDACKLIAKIKES